MHPHVFLNDRLLEASKARLPAVAGAALYGRGVFTTLAVYGGLPFLWDAHWSRLNDHARRAGVECPFDEEETRASLARLIEKNKVERGRARVTILARGSGGIWQEAADAGSEGGEGGDGVVVVGNGGARASDLLILTGEARRADEETLALTISPFRANTHSPLAGLKTVNYLAHVLSLEEARSRDFDEALVLNERGEVASATMANIFWVKHGTVYTPALATGALAGTTRARVIELAEEMAVPLVEGVQDIHALADADEIFLTSAGLGVALVTTFDFHRYTVPVGSVALRLGEAFRQLTLGAA
ncbi:MAG: aminotransferase class IV [Acidobacteria bacterium]|nr:aminotransferase class IV [Acidobacteriota bacterium]